VWWALDLFSGTGSVKKALEALGYRVISVDNDRRWQADITVDILKWRYWEDFERHQFSLVVASPPCTEYSSAMTRRERHLAQSDKLVKKAIEIIRWFDPPKWWIENPRYGLLRTRTFMRHLDFVDIDYCMFSTFGYRKPTRFWIPRWMAGQLEHVICNGECGNMAKDEDGSRRHRSQIGGNALVKATKYQAYRIPQGVVEYLCGLSSKPDPSAQPTDTQVKAQESEGPRLESEESEAITVRRESGQTTSHQSKHVQEVIVRPWQHHPKFPMTIGRMERRGGGYQLMMEVTVRAAGHTRSATALVDTGAQTTLVRRDLFPSDAFCDSNHPLLLRTVSGEQLQGGQREVTMEMEFAAETEEGDQAPAPYVTKVTAHDGEVGVDIILGYPWLKVQRLDIQPWRDALQLHDPPHWILCKPTARKGKKKMIIMEEEPTLAQVICEEPELESTVMEVRKMWANKEEEDEETATPRQDEETTEEEKEEQSKDSEILEAARQLLRTKEELEREVRGVILSEDEDQSMLACQLRQEILEEFTGRVFCEEVWKNPPARGTHGLAKLHLKPGIAPITGRIIHLKGERLDAMKDLEAELRRDQKIEPGRGPWRAAAFPIKKKSGKWRGVCDYALTNKAIQPDSYPLPLTEEIVSEQACCEIFSTIDLKDAFHQVALDPSSRQITNIQLPGGLWQWRVVPQGINVGPALLQRDIDATCRSVEHHSRPYFDDILVSTKRQPGQMDEELLQQHATELRETLTALEKDRWVSDKAKVRLFMKRIEFVGHVLGGGKRSPAPGKLAAVQKWEVPQTVSALRAFLGVCTYYAGYIRMFAEFAAPLQEKLKLPKELTRAGSKHKLDWTTEEVEAF
jgi:hypothetical protein